MKYQIMSIERNIIFSVRNVGLFIFIVLFGKVLSSKFDGVKNVTNITVGYLTVDRTLNFMRGKQARVISGAISYALELINNDTKILPNHRLNLIWGDTMADTLVGTRLLTDQWRKGAKVFIGLEDSCSVEAKVAAAWNLPMISYKCADYDVSNKEEFPTFARTFPPATQVAKPIISLLLHFNWKKFTLIFGSLHKSKVIAEKIRELAAQNNITINDEQTFNDPHIPLTMGNPFPGIVERTFVDTRVYVFLGTYNGIVDMMTNMYDRGLLDTGEYVVIYFDHETVDTIDPFRYYRRTSDPPLTKTNEEAVRSLLVITGSPPSNPNYDDFKEIVSLYGERKPFSFPNPFNFQRKISVYAAYLYDAVMLYAKAAHQHLEEGGDITNGTAIIQKILGSNYVGIQGFISHIDENGDAEGNYTLLSRQPFKTNLSDYSMRPVGHFEMDKNYNGLPVFRVLPKNMIHWVNGEPPIDEPECGYRAQKCIPPKTYTLEILGGTIGGIALVAIIVVLIIYRNWRYEQEIAGLLWRINREDLKTPDSMASNGRRDSFGSRMTLSQLSVDSRMSFTQVYARTGGYKGQIVALKMYEKKNLYFNRKMKKEMKLMRDLRHSNINTFLGACIDPPVFIIVTEYCSKGSLLDILENEDLKLDSMFIFSIIRDILQGMIFLHDSELVYHGNLKSSNCVVNSRWTVQITDFGLLEVRAATYKMEDEHAFYRNLFWKAPECLKSSVLKGSQKGDVYAFGIILHEIFGRAGPYGFCNMSPREIVERVRTDSEPFRPNVRLLSCESFIIECMQSCWNEVPDERPDFRTIRKVLTPLRHGSKRNIFDNMMAMMEKYQKNLEDIVEERTTLLIEEKKKTEALLLRMLPKCVADQLKLGEAVIPESYSCVTIYFSDICGFTHLSAESTPMQVVDMLNDLYTIFDNIIRHFDVFKIETIGDAYMVVSGLPIRNGDIHAGEIASMSLKLLMEIKNFRVRHRPDYKMSLRIGMHSGPCVAGVVGLTMPRYTLFGDTVNTASRMETNGEPMKIHCSQQSKDILEKLGGYNLESRGKVAMKGKGELFTYWLLSEDESIRLERIKNAPMITDIYRNNYFQPGTPNVGHKCFNSNKIKSSPQNFLGKTTHNCENDDNLKVPDPNILELIRETDKVHPRNDTQMLKTLNHCQREPASNATVHGVNSIHVNLKAPINGLASDLFTRSSSGSDLTSPKHFSSRDTNGISNDTTNEAECLLIRHHSVGHRPKSRYGLTANVCNNSSGAIRSDKMLQGEEEIVNTKV
ncbi:receptor-type guanylate cyclase Gyc76C-like [Mercenaria mercenaria]|uniref:receptor-type guanylate cyclase Gyc76C-like n=1 Tax=Mercenaria mercenaria TaxID=6596 RepID=UPI00234FA9D3|nr:receptor-type guanylate cyclase Gyc76C-like [Mercenaria mercenaria]